jgi:hypothetical protein
MRYLLWAVGIISFVAFISVIADGGDGVDAARVAPRELNRLPASTQDPIPDAASSKLSLPKELEGSSIEVGFTQDGEPEPHLLAVAGEGTVKLYELQENAPATDRKKATAPTPAPEGEASKTMPVELYVKRMSQAIDVDHFFTALQPRPKRRCKDQYVVRIKRGSKFRERRGCSNQSNDAFAALAQNAFRDAFLVWRKGK